jgi:hypothetical protein
MKLTTLLLCLTCLPVAAAPVRPALDTTLRGANGTEVSFRVVGVWADGFHAAQAPGRPPLFVGWDRVDAEWLATERPQIVALKAKARPFPALSPEQAQARLDAARKTFRAPRVVTYLHVDHARHISQQRTSPNALAESYATKLRSLTPANITGGLQQIIADRERDLARLATARGADAAQRDWLATSFLSTLVALEQAQRALDPLAAGEIVVTPPRDRTAVASASDTWF